MNRSFSVKTTATLTTILFLASMLSIAFNVALVKALVSRTIPIYISVDTMLEDNYEFIGCDGFIVVADGITLDLDGHTVTGSGTRKGVLLPSGRTGVTVKNGKIVNFGYGIQLWEAEGNVIKDVEVTESVWDGGISVEYSDENTIRDSYVHDNSGHGIKLWFSDDNIVKDNEITSNGINGIIVVGSSGDEITGNAILENGGYGIQLWESNDNTIKENEVVENTWTGISLEYSSKNTIKENTVSLNVNHGIQLWAADLHMPADENIVVENEVTLNGWTGIFLEHSSSNTISENLVSDNGNYGFSLWESDSNTINENEVTLNSWSGIWLGESDTNTLSENIASYNTIYGIAITVYSSYNTMRENVAIGNGVQDLFDDGTGIGNIWM